MTYRREVPTAAGVAHVIFTDRADGDFRPGPDPASAAGPVDPADVLVGHRRSWLRQVHGAEVITVATPGEAVGAEGDALVTAQPRAVLSVLGADCPLVALISAAGVVGVAHAGWRGLVAGVLPATVSAMVELGAGDVTALLGPCICPQHYQFGAADLDLVANRLGFQVRARTGDGRPALDLLAAVEASLEPMGVTVDRSGWRCTAAGSEQFSHRARADRGRHAALVWLQPGAGADRGVHSDG
ncbi:MAG: polyphenol oxidase family protein [Acidimicrobiales bacterium]